MSAMTPAPLMTPAFVHLFTMSADLAPSLDAGDGPLGRRALNAVSRGRFAGARLNGDINPGTGDWMLTRNGVRVVDVQIPAHRGHRFRRIADSVPVIADSA